MPLEEALAVRAQRLDSLRGRLLAALRAGPVAGAAPARRGVTLEIGCGHGHFLTAYAAAHPEEFCIGIDLLPGRLERAGRKSSAAGLANVVWLQAEAELFLEAMRVLPGDGDGAVAVVLERVWVLFPDPWPKRRHWKNRLLRPAFLDTLAERMRAGGELCFRTDHAPYFAEARDCVAAHPAWELVAVAADGPGNSNGPGNADGTDGGAWPFEVETVFQSRAPSFQSLVARRNGQR
ncbi:MAG: methyltransferase domain-containing protein [Opitutaceae bacterium]|jgi:tRNA (guanine-N7-)-methyltransferase|nr:methyltransferase domain-containing protein [Opitutaceae bacterium]